MIQSETYITAEELFRKVEKILTISTNQPQHVNKKLHETLVLTCTAGLRDTPYDFGDLNSRVDYLCKKCGISPTDTYAIHKLRRDSNTSSLILPENILSDVRALCVFISAVFREAIPAFLVGKIPAKTLQSKPTLRLDQHSIRCIVKQWDKQYIWAMPDTDTNGELLQIVYNSEKQFADMAYLYDILREGMQLNLLDCEVNYLFAIPRLIIVEPDYLIDISSLAACFTNYGHHPAMYTLNRLKERANTRHTILGNFASCALDNIIHAEENTTFSINETLKENYKEKALEYCTCEEFNPTEFKINANRQAINMQQMVAELFKNYPKERAILEPSFVCEHLGVQGRVDMMTTDFGLLVEQKSGKNIYIEYNNTNKHGNKQIEPHYVQALLYAAVLKYNFRLSKKATQIFLLYSKYALPAGLMAVTQLDVLLYKAIRLRNLIVETDYQMAMRGAEPVIKQLNPQILNTKKLNDNFYKRYLLPQIESITQPLTQMSALEKAYFCRMMRFVIKEQIIAKMGSADGNGRSNADLWSLPLSEKREMGNIYVGLRIIKKKQTGQRGFDEITLSVPFQGDDFLPNFRRGDMVYLYGYHPETEPDVRRSILFKGFMQDIKTNEIVIHLANAQQNEDILYVEAEANHIKKRLPLMYAVEHSASDVGGSAAMNALHTLITAPQKRRNLLLGQCEPTVDSSKTLTKSYHPDYDEVLLKAKQANDYFLLVGPPGTGKTSMALRFMVEEELTTPNTNILLMAYTNRAVDEICSMLTDANLNFFRLGNEYSCDPRFASHLMEYAVAANQKLSELKNKLQSVRIIVSTTSMMMNKPFLFALKHFSVAIIDEASQILEPHIIGILASHMATHLDASKPNNLRCNIDKFILVGDYKQLPAVVQQSEAESKVVDVALQNIGLYDCRNSLFERLIRWEERKGRTQQMGILRKQGRMHPEIASFPNQMFYAKERLLPVPLPHQTAKDIGYLGTPIDEIDKLLVQHRRLFYSSQYCSEVQLSDKVNIDEAKMVANLLQRIYRLTQQKLNPQKTVGVIVPYRNQIAMIRREIEKTGIDVLKDICIDTVERYQGSQRDIIIYSFTIQHRYQLDFLTANSFYEGKQLIDRKLNVALTRARKQLILLGHEPTLMANTLFRLLIQNIPNRLC